MIKLIPLNIDEKVAFEQIISKKHISNRVTLEKIKPAIFEDYDMYFNNETRLQILNPDNRIGVAEKVLLHAAYKNGKKIEEIKAKILKNMPDVIREKCPYCMLSEPNTFDHYLDKKTFPEYSVFSRNLVPCCSKCNSLKGSKFLTNNRKRMFISFYFDKMPKNSFLKVQIDIENNIPYLRQLTVEFEDDTDISNIIETHFKELQLCERYKLPISTRLSCIWNELSSYEDYSVEDLKDIIKKKINAIERQYGNNYWETCLYKGILANDELIRLICKKTTEFCQR